MSDVIFLSVFLIVLLIIGCFWVLGYKNNIMNKYNWVVPLILIIAIIVWGKMNRYELSYYSGKPILYDNFSNCFYMVHLQKEVITETLTKSDPIPVPEDSPEPPPSQSTGDPDLDRLQRRFEARNAGKKSKKLTIIKNEAVKICPLDNVVKGFS